MRVRLPARRLSALLVILGLVAVPAVVLRAFCAGQSCKDSGAAATTVPFCPLPSDLRALIAAGFRSGRSPDAMGAGGITTTLEGVDVPWPSQQQIAATRVPIGFFGPGVRRGELPSGTGLDQIAPTLSSAIGLRRAHPEIRAGQAVPGVLRPGHLRPPLLVEIVWAGIGSVDLGGDWPSRTAELVRAGTSTMEGVTGSLPVDPAATLTTIGTGGSPAQHGITGSLVRGKTGDVTPPWSAGAPDSVISTLPDDLVHVHAGSEVELVAPSPIDRGLVGNGWYLGADRHRLNTSEDPVRSVSRSLSAGVGTGGSPDVLGVVLNGDPASQDRATARIVGEIRSRVPDALFVVTATGSLRTSPGAEPATAVARRIDRQIGAPVAGEAVGGGFFLDQAALNDAGDSADDVVEALRGLTTTRGGPLFADAFPSFSVAFSRYCR